MKFIKKAIVVEAEQYIKGKDIDGLCFDSFHMNKIYPTPHIHTLEGIHIVIEKDWIITGIKGEKYPCKPDIFELTYEKFDINNSITCPFCRKDIITGKPSNSCMKGEQI